MSATSSTAVAFFIKPLLAHYDGTRLAVKTRHRVGIGRQLFWQDLDCDIAAESGIPRSIHFTHATGAEGGDNFIRAEARSWGKGHGSMRDYRTGRLAPVEVLVFADGRDRAERRSTAGRRCSRGRAAPRRARTGDALADDLLLLRPAGQRTRDRRLAPTLLLGRDGQCPHARAVLAPYPIVPRNRPDRVSLCAARPERLEPLSTFRGGVGSGAHRRAVCHLGRLERPFPQKPAAGRERSFDAGV